MKPAIDRKSGSPPTGQLACVPGMDIPPRSLFSLPPGGLVSRSGRPFPTDIVPFGVFNDG